MNTPRFSTLACLAALATTSLSGMAQDATPPASPPATPAASETPSAEAIFEAYIEAVGGADAIRAQSHRKLSGTYRGVPFANGARITLWQEAPNKAHLRLAEPLGSNYSIYFNGETAWETGTDGVSRVLSGSDRIEMIETADFFGETNYAERYEEMRVIGAADVGGDEAWAVYARSHAGRERTLFFSKTSHLFIAEESTIGGENPVKVQVALDQYEDVGGVLFPMRQRQQIANSTRRVEIVYRAASVETFEHDFDPPGDVIPAPEPVEDDEAPSDG